MPRPAASGPFLLNSDVVAGAPSVRQRQALSHEPLVDIDLLNEAAGDDPPVTFNVALVAADGAARDQILQRERGPLTAAPGAAASIEAGLAALRRVDAVQSDALPINLDRVARR